MFISQTSEKKGEEKEKKNQQKSQILHAYLIKKASTRELDTELIIQEILKTRIKKLREEINVFFFFFKFFSKENKLTYRIIDGFKWRKVVFPVGEKELKKKL